MEQRLECCIQGSSGETGFMEQKKSGLTLEAAKVISVVAAVLTGDVTGTSSIIIDAMLSAGLKRVINPSMDFGMVLKMVLLL